MISDASSSKLRFQLVIFFDGAEKDAVVLFHAAIGQQDVFPATQRLSVV